MFDEFEDSYGAATARYYDAAYAHHEAARLGPDVVFYRELAAGLGGPVLELGCGTGRALLPMLRDGRDCTGVDASEAMLAVLRRKAEAAGGTPPRLVRARMQDFDLGSARFALIFSAFRAFQHLYTVEDQLACLARVRAHLAPGGRLAFDVFNPRPERMALDVEEEAEDVRFPWGEGEVVRRVASTRDHARQLIDVRMWYDRYESGRCVETEETRFQMRWYTRFELEHLMVRAGFGDVAIYGDYDRSPVTRESPSLVVVAG